MLDSPVKPKMPRAWLYVTHCEAEDWLRLAETLHAPS
jgi:hypothetical protein